MKTYKDIKMKNGMFKHVVISTSLLLSSIVSLTVSAESSVWKVSKGNDYIYIGGTVHILPPSEFPLPKEFNQAYQKSDAIVLEVKLPDPSDSALQIQMMQQMAYSNGKTIKDVLSRETQEKLTDYLSGLGMELAMVEAFKPGFLMVMLMMVEAQKAQLSGEGVDLYFSKLATKDNKSIEYFETLAFQMNMISSMGEGDEDNFIQSNLDQMKDFKAMWSGVLSAWRLGDTKKLEKLVVEPMKSDAKTLQTLLIDRNKSWLGQIEAMFNDSDKEFVLVGTAHLVGDKSVLALLKARGYQVEKK